MKSLQVAIITILTIAVIIRIALSIYFPASVVNGQQISFSTTLLSEPTGHGSYDTVTVVYTNGFSSSPITLILPAGNGAHYGQSMSVSGTVKLRKLTAISNQKVKAPDNTKTIATIYFPHISINSEGENIFFSVSYFLRQHIQDFYEKIFSPRLAALLLGIVLGVRGNFPKEFLSNLQATGVMHVIAASGMNVTMVSGFLLSVFTTFLRRQAAILCTLAGLLFYCIISGMQASILRATILIAFALSAQIFGRQYSGLYGLILAAGGMLLYNPVWFFDVGFQLSFAATLGIFFLKPILPLKGILSEDVATTFSAQVATLPILVGSFGSYGLLSVLVNALVLWTIPPLMVLGGIGGLIGLVLEPIGHILLILCFPFLLLFEYVVTFFGNFHLLFSLPYLPIPMVVGYYLLIISIVISARIRRDKSY